MEITLVFLIAIPFVCAAFAIWYVRKPKKSTAYRYSDYNAKTGKVYDNHANDWVLWHMVLDSDPAADEDCDPSIRESVSSCDRSSTESSSSTLSSSYSDSVSSSDYSSSSYSSGYSGSSGYSSSSSSYDSGSSSSSSIFD